jgi:phospholipid/cholesterol/gamma-HCH transport system permease protein
MPASYTTRLDKSGSAVDVLLQGPWTVAALSAIEQALPEARLSGFRRVTLDGAGVAELDTAGAWYLHHIARELRRLNIDVELKNFSENWKLILGRVGALPEAPAPVVRRLGAFEGPVVFLGRKVADMARDARRGTRFFGQFLAIMAARILQPGLWRPRSVVFHINEAGLKAVPIIALMSFSLAFVTAYQGAYQLTRFDATVFTIDLVALSILRELGVLLVAIMLAGRSGSAFAAQLGTMRLNEEVDALQTMGVSPFEVLVLPRLLAMLVALPLLTMIADVMGLFGGYVYMSTFLDYSWLQYFARLKEAAEIKHLYVGLCKAPFFALLIGTVGCMQGLRASTSAEEVGRRTITAVVQSIFLVVVADALFSVVFTKLGV